MSDLQIALLLIGAAIVVAVLAFNWIQERRFRKQAAQAFQAPARDALLETAAVPRERAGRIEPGLNEPVLGNLDDSMDVHDEPRVRIDAGELAASSRSEPPPSVRPVEASHDAVTPMRPVKPAASTASLKAASTEVAAPPAPIDELIEYRIRIGGDGILSSVFADAINRTRAMGKAVRWIGLPAGGTAWQAVQPSRDVHFQEVDIAVQVADRNGAIEENDLAELCALVKSITQTRGLRFACDDVVEAVERAQTLDRFCVDVDVLIGLNVVARGEGTMNLSKVLREAENAGMVLGPDGVYQLRDSRGEVLYSLGNHDAEPFPRETTSEEGTPGVTLQFDVPRVPDGVRIFNDMVAFGRKLANEAGGLLVDDNMKPLTDAGIEKIRQQLARIYERMEARGVPSGSRRALRLFS